MPVRAWKWAPILDGFLFQDSETGVGTTTQNST
jgi:hypothetical protein